MLEKIRYMNHFGEEVQFGSGGIYVQENNLRDYAWTYKSHNDKISSFSRGIQEKTIPIVIKCETVEEATAAKNALYEIMEKDVLMKEYGKIIIGDYYMKCYVLGSTKEEYLLSGTRINIKLRVVTDCPYWIKETEFHFLPRNRRPDEDTGSLDFENDFPYDYTSTLLNMAVVNTGFIGSNFRMIIYGGCVNPEINIAGHLYNVNVDLSPNEYVVIDSVKKTITMTRYNGTQVNVFNSRNKESYIFKEIPSGNNMVSWNNDFGFDIILLEERGEPKWI